VLRHLARWPAKPPCNLAQVSGGQSAVHAEHLPGGLQQLQAVPGTGQPDRAGSADAPGRRILAGRCERFHSKQEAIKQAQQVQQAKLRADVVLGTVEVTEQQPADDIGAFTQQVEAVLDAYRRLARDVTDET
jgi:hypothetical protein